MALSQTSVLKLYNTVIEDVINGVRDSFIDEGVDEQVLQELKQIWENKLMASKAVELNPEPPEPQPPQLNTYKNTTGKGGSKKNTNANKETAKQEQAQLKSQQQAQAQQNSHTQQQQLPDVKPPIPVPQTVAQQSSATQSVTMPQQTVNKKQAVKKQAAATQQHQIQHVQQQQVLQQQQTVQQQLPVQQQQAPIPAAPQQVINTVPTPVVDRQVSIQIKLPVHQSLPERLVTVHVPASAIQGNQLPAIFSGPIITAAIGLPVQYATSLLQQHINSTFAGHPGFTPVPIPHPVQVVSNSMVQPLVQPVPTQHQGNMAQLDGAHGDSSDDDDDDDDDDNDDDDEDIDKEEEENDEASAREEEPLNSEDDVTDDDPTDLFDTENVVVCQYDKITRSRNKWKFYLKDGIMNLSGKDFVFQKANGDAEW